MGSQLHSPVQELMERARATSQRQAAESSTAATEATSEQARKFAQIEQNAFYKIMFDTNLSPEQKMESAAQTLTFAEEKGESEARLEEFRMFKEYLQFERKRMAQQIIDLTDTEAFSELKQIYDDLNNALLNFEDRIAPLTDIVDAVYQLRMNGLTFDAFHEIAMDKEAEARIAALKAEQEGRIKTLTHQMRAINDEIAALGEEKALFGLGGIKESARKAIARKQNEMAEKKAELNDIRRQVEDASLYKIPDSQLGEEFLQSKAKLRELLDISSQEHMERQKALVAAAQDFVNKTESRVASISEHFGRMDGQIDNLMDANYSMREIYAILNDATKKAHVENEKKRDLLSADAAEDSDLAKMNRERKKRDLENHIGELNASSVDTTAVLAELTNSSHRIKSMKDGNQQQINRMRQIHSSGVAGVADQLSTVLQAVSAAALGESSEMARMSLERTNTKTQDLTQKEVTEEEIERSKAVFLP